MRPACSALRIVALTLAALLPQRLLASAGRPLNTDDATLTNARSCQVETWFQHAQGDAQFWVLPACNFSGFEATLGTTLDWMQGGTDSSSLVLQGKVLGPNPAWLPEKIARYGWVVGATYLHEAHGGPRDWQVLSTYVPLTINLTPTDQVHVNLGYTRDRVAGTGDGTYGLAASHDFNKHWTVQSEIFGVFNGPPSAQAAFEAIFGSFQFDASFGRPLTGRWNGAIFSIGIEWYPQALW